MHLDVPGLLNPKLFKIMRQQLIIALFVVGLFSSCTDSNRTIYLIADEADGLTAEADVTLNGFKVGEVEDIQFHKRGRLLVELRLHKEPAIPKDSEFTIQSRDLLGAKEVSIQPGNNEATILNGDTVRVLMEQQIFNSDSLPISVKNLLEDLTGAKQRDSILQELRRLNTNLEDLKK